MTGVFGCYWFAQGKLILRPHLYDRIGRECIFGHRQVARRRAFANPRGGIVLRAVARAEITAVFAARPAILVAPRPAAEMRADADRDQPVLVAFLGSLPARLGIAPVGPRPPTPPGDFPRR